MSEFVKVADLNDITDPGHIVAEVEDHIIAVFRVEGNVYAIDDVCTHDGGPLAEGELEGHAVACPRHGAKFDIRTGEALSMPAIKPTATFEVKVENDEVFVKLP